MIAGRLVALVSFLAVGLGIFLVVMAICRSPGGGLFGALVFGVYALMHFPDYVGMNDPQWLAHALATSGLALLVWRGDTTHNASGFGAGVMMALALLVKHTLIALPAALLLELLLRRTRPLKAWAAGFVLTGLMSAIVCFATWALSCTPTSCSRQEPGVSGTSSEKVAQTVTPLSPLAVAVVLWLSSSGGWIRWRVFVVYAFCSLGLAVALLGGDGVNYNLLFDLNIALTILAGAAVSPGLEATAGSRHGFRAALAGTITVALLVPAPAAALREYANLQLLHQRQQDSERDIAIIAEHPDPVVCQTIVLCYWAGREWSLDWGNARRKLMAGAIRESALLGPIERRRFTLLQVDSYPQTPAFSVFTAVIEHAVEENYTVVRTSPGRAVLEPRAKTP